MDFISLHDGVLGDLVVDLIKAGGMLTKDTLQKKEATC
jgi:hypothetical protein